MQACVLFNIIIKACLRLKKIRKGKPVCRLICRNGKAEMANLALMEQLALYFTSLPCPPLPVRVSGILTTSHDMLAGLLIAAMTRGNRALDETRKHKQISITRKLVSQCEAATDATNVYEHCKEFTAEYVHAFDDAGTCTPTMCFLATDEVEKGDKVHSAICSWHAAQDILFTAPADQRKAAVFALMSYEQLIQLHWQRFRESLDADLSLCESSLP